MITKTKPVFVTRYSNNHAGKLSALYWQLLVYVFPFWYLGNQKPNIENNEKTCYNNIRQKRPQIITNRGDMPMDKELDSQDLQQPTETLDETIIQITGQPKRQYTQQEIDEARQNLALMNDRVFLAHFIDNKNNHTITGLADAARKIHALPPIPQVQRTTVQNVSLLDVLGRGMIGDLLGWGEAINIALEVQKGKQDGFAVRGTLTSSNAMRTGFNMGDDFTEAPDVIGINILGFKLPQLSHRKEFVSRIVRAEYDSKIPFLDDKYSD